MSVASKAGSGSPGQTAAVLKGFRHQEREFQ